MQICFCTQNAHKLNEAKHILPQKYILLGLKDIDFHDEIIEYGNTFYENAYIKAKSIYEKYQIACFADDSGLCTNALDGKPGVYSARYAGEKATDNQNIKKLLAEMNGHTDRSAYFITVICLIMNEQVWYFEGKIDGRIGHEAIGNQGFGYDPVFVPDGYQITFAQMDLTTKSSISHRALALKKLDEHLRKIIGY